MKTFTAIAERDSDTKFYVGYIPGFSGAHSQCETLDELQENLREVIKMLLKDEDLVFETEFVSTQQIVVY
ncbi:type II toxin-antitoxin system HicB family antitoxin [Nostoc sp. DedQUE09]|uniref:type II toxin-antitoxin system HicB family antitoxin n=1 Tax=Nostoc sp. DedQUE09 TaxID=3075394 RepID=UPI002AD2BFD5|nr:type II toxin-antitoxin system HicB family antitoxin [Nostoc sp. DedQUE09]MDZ7954663.1 type II toxin-antitoxin system HicB family antitoxin [Nostoc sp. DedQUE09]